MSSKILGLIFTLTVCLAQPAVGAEPWADRWEGAYAGALADARWGGGESRQDGEQVGDASLQGEGASLFVGHRIRFERLLLGVELEGGLSTLGGVVEEEFMGEPEWFDLNFEWSVASRAVVGTTVDRFLIFAAAGPRLAGFRLRGENEYDFGGSTWTSSFDLAGLWLGWSFGVGTEVALTDRVSARLELTHDTGLTTVSTCSSCKLGQSTTGVRAGLAIAIP